MANGNFNLWPQNVGQQQAPWLDPNSGWGQGVAPGGGGFQQNNLMQNSGYQPSVPLTPVPGGPGNSGFTPQTTMPNTGGGFDWGGLAQGAGGILQGAGSLAQAWAGFKGLELAKKDLEHRRTMDAENLAAMKTTTNNMIANQNAWKAAQGRKDKSQTV